MMIIWRNINRKLTNNCQSWNNWDSNSTGYQLCCWKHPSQNDNFDMSRHLSCLSTCVHEDVSQGWNRCINVDRFVPIVCISFSHKPYYLLHCRWSMNFMHVFCNLSNYAFEACWASMLGNRCAFPVSLILRQHKIVPRYLLHIGE